MDSNIGSAAPELRGLTALESLDLGWVALSEAGLGATLAGLTAAPLCELHVCDYRMPQYKRGADRDLSGSFLTAVAALTRLTSLGVFVDSVSDAQLAAVSTLCGLKQLWVNSHAASDVWSRAIAAGVAPLTRLTTLELMSGGHVCGVATSRLLSLQAMETLRIRVVGRTRRDTVRELADGLPKLQLLFGAVEGLPHEACSRLTRLTRLRGCLDVKSEGLSYRLGPAVQEPVVPIAGMAGAGGSSEG